MYYIVETDKSFASASDDLEMLSALSGDADLRKIAEEVEEATRAMIDEAR